MWFQKADVFGSIFLKFRQGILVADLDGKIIAVNPAYEKIFSGSRDAIDVVGKNIRELAEQIVNPADRYYLIDHLDKNTKPPVWYNTYQVKVSEKKLIWVKVEGYIAKDHEDNDYLLVAFVNDVTEQVRRNNELKGLTRSMANLLNTVHLEPAMRYGLTGAEIKVAQLIKQGHANKRIAEELGLSVHTVGAHRKSIRKKLRLKPKENLVTALAGYIV